MCFDRPATREAGDLLVCEACYADAYPEGKTGLDRLPSPFDGIHRATAEPRPRFTPPTSEEMAADFKRIAAMTLAAGAVETC